MPNRRTITALIDAGRSEPLRFLREMGIDEIDLLVATHPSTLADEHPHPRQQAMFNEVMRHEWDFWRTTWKG